MAPGEIKNNKDEDKKDWAVRKVICNLRETGIMSVAEANARSFKKRKRLERKWKQWAWVIC